MPIEEVGYSGSPREPDPQRHLDQAQIEKLKAKIIKLSEQIREADESQKDNLRRTQDRLKLQVNALWRKWARDKSHPPYKVDRKETYK